MHEIVEGVVLPLCDIPLHGENFMCVSLVIDGHIAFDEYDVDGQIFGESIIGIANHLSTCG